MGSFCVLVFGVLIGGSKKDQFLGSVGHGIRLWFALTGVIVDCRFLRPRRAIEMIEVIEMIEMIEVSGGGAGRDTLREGLGGGSQVGDILDFRGFGSGQMYGSCLWFERFGKTGNPRFPAAPHPVTLDCVPFKGVGAF